jgi:hypothetical protein
MIEPNRARWTGGGGFGGPRGVGHRGGANGREERRMGPAAYARIAAISGAMPKMFMTRVRL